MPRLLNLLTLLFLILIISACRGQQTVSIIPEPAPEQNRPTSHLGLSLQLETNTFNETPSHIDTIITNDSLYQYEYGEFYHIEHLVDNLWHMITYSDFVFTANPTFKDSGYLLDPGEKAYQSFSIEQLKVTLYPGKYRLVKTFLAKEEPFHEISVAAPFTVH